MCILNFHLVPNTPNVFNISHLLSANYSYFAFSNITLFYVTVNFFPIYCYFMSATPPPTNSAVKTLPLHTPIGLVLSFFFLFPMNSQFDFFILTEFLFSFNIQNRSACHIPVYVLSFQFVYFQQTPPPYQSWYSPTANIIDYLDPGTMLQQNSTVIISTTVLETVSSSQFTNHPFIPG